MKTILVVCTANICRSPMVSGVLRDRLAAAGLAHQVQVISAGVHALEGQPAAAYGVELLAAKGMDISGHRATQLEEWAIEQADLILVMEEAHARQVFYYSPANMHKVILFSELIGERTDLADPYGKKHDAYLATLQLIERTIDSGWGKLLSLLRVKPTEIGD